MRVGLATDTGKCAIGWVDIIHYKGWVDIILYKGWVDIIHYKGWVDIYSQKHLNKHQPKLFTFYSETPDILFKNVSKNISSLLNKKGFTRATFSLLLTFL